MTVIVQGFSSRYLTGVLSLCQAEGWPTLPADPARAERALTAPGCTTLVALDNEAVVGFAQVLSDGHVQAFLATLAVRADRRGEGIGRTLVHEGLRHAGGIRMDLVTEDADAFYLRLRSKRMSGFRVYLPDA